MNAQRRVATVTLLALLLTGLTPVLRPAAADDQPDKNRQGEEKTYDYQTSLDEASRALADYTAEQRDQASSTIEKQLRELDRNIDRLSERMSEQWNDLSEAGRRQWQETRREMQQQRIEVAEWYGGIKRGSAEAWEEMKKGYSRAYSDLARSWQRAREEFASGDGGNKDSAE